MLAELVEKLQSLAIVAEMPRIVEESVEPDHVYLLAKPGGAIEKMRAEPAPRQHVALSPEAIRDYLNAESVESIWFSRAAVVAILDAERRERITFTLQLSDQLKTLQTLEKRQWMKQAQFVSLLRISLHDCLGPAGDILATCRRLKFKQLQDGEAAIEHGKASIGRTLQAELSGAGIIPELVSMDVPVFHNLRLPLSRVQCAIDIDAPAESLALIPLAGEIERAIQAAESKLGERLAELLPDTLRVYGNP